ncbi:MAG: protein-methionine-sulfoxide reductase heme-binding subunit MsrQ [Myxococcota bacterium]|jgi:sulfoxide reductase heme-binding subunit YedZ|nr:protein-methionine-sulfoxide reductase heme-binding subunit MsrQ [Myxococcota bacterium]
MNSKRLQKALRGALYILNFAPGIVLAGRFLLHDLGPNPIEEVLLYSGFWALVLLLCTLSISPLVKIFALGWLMPTRKWFGLGAFFYATCHLLFYLALDQELNLDWIVEDVLDRWFIFLGSGAFLLLLPLALTSNKMMLRRLGAKTWQKLHLLIYPGTFLALLHFYFKKAAKNDDQEPLIYLGIFVLLIAWRLLRKLKRK